MPTAIRFLQDTMSRHESRFTKILLILCGYTAGSSAPSVSSSALKNLDDKIHELSAAIEKLQDSAWKNDIAPFPTHHSIQDMDQSIRDLKNQVQRLQLRVVGSGVQVGGIVFQCFKDVKTWVLCKFPIRRYGLFVYAVSLLDLFTCVSHVEAEKSFSAFYNQQKSGFVSMNKARVAASVQNLFPMVFGRSNSSGLDNSEYLPAIQDPDKWDNGITGLHYQIVKACLM
jgi:hypothetical protein